ncbi:NAD kinase [Pleomorphovibrio marinus]|uniref:NAD kinase n=1 Tax=Pleomorphovibrio marinus TaxID=2164132 RepID=UPI000E0A2C9F|nr:NAD kinase [Pleomorphovibrio marinus]
MKVILHGLGFAPEFKPYIEKLIHLLRDHEFQLYITPRFRKSVSSWNLPTKGFEVLETREEISQMDIFVSIGGDGTLLDAVCMVGEYEIPIMGINTGRLGFLSTIAKDDLKMAVKVLAEKAYDLESRALVRLEAGADIFGGLNFGLNEFTIHKRDTSSMITVHTYLDGEYLNSYWADGLIVSTPTGSTGYSLSCGGPLISPAAKNFVITPVSPHNLNVRPMVVSDESEITFKIEGRSEKFLVSLDSRSTAIDASIGLKIRKESFVAKLVKCHDYSFFDTLRQKLNWGFDMRN